MRLPDPYPVPVWTRPCRGTVRVPGSKSLTNRALILAALSAEVVRLEGALFSRDSALLVANLQALGFRVEEDAEQNRFTVHGQGGRIPRDEAALFVGNAGTAARFLTAFVCLHPAGTYSFDGDPEMRERPMGGLIAALEELGARFSFGGKPGHFPFRVSTSGLRGGEWRVEAGASSQMLSALMMVAPFADQPVRLLAEKVRPAFVDMTARIMAAFGAHIAGGPEIGYRVRPAKAYARPTGVFRIEPDVTAASYFMALPFVTGGELTIEGMPEHSLQGDVAFADVLRELGFAIADTGSGWTIRPPMEPEQAPRTFVFERFSDTFLTLAAVAPLFPFPIEITGIGHTRLQETDRIAAMTTELRRTGAEVEEQPEAIRIQPYSAHALPQVIQVHTYKDHRVAMAFAVLGCRNRFADGRPWIEIRDPACCGKTFPDFFSRLNHLYLECHDNS